MYSANWQKMQGGLDFLHRFFEMIRFYSVTLYNAAKRFISDLVHAYAATPGRPYRFKNSRYDIGLTNSPIGKGSADLFEIFIDHLGNAPDAIAGKNVLIVGFGDTVSEIVAVARLLPMASRLICADAVGELIIQAEKKIGAEFPQFLERVTFYHAALSDLSPIDDESIALILGCGLSIHDGPEINVREITRVLHPGGIACLVVDVKIDIRNAMVEHFAKCGTVSAPTPFYVLFQKAGSPIFQQKLGTLELAAGKRSNYFPPNL